MSAKAHKGMSILKNFGFKQPNYFWITPGRNILFLAFAALQPPFTTMIIIWAAWSCICRIAGDHWGQRFRSSKWQVLSKKF